MQSAGAAILLSRVHEMGGSATGGELVQQAMRSPIGSRPLWELARGKRSATILISDHTRPVPSRDILPHMLCELRSGSPDIAITLLVATGCHRGTTAQELSAKLGEEIVSSERILVHDCANAAQTITIGTLPSGAPLTINRAAVDTELLVAEGFIEPHFFAGFSGGRKSVLPGICDRETVLGNHCGAFIDSPYARTGILAGNPIQEDMLAAVKLAKLAYIVNVIINENKQTVAAFAGNPVHAHKAGCDYLEQYCCVQAAPADIVVTTNGGAPLDQNIYQSVKGLTAAEASAKPGAVLIICAQCADGTGSDAFYELMAQSGDMETFHNRLAQTPQKDTLPDQWQAQVLARILIKHRVIFVTEPKWQKEIRRMNMDYAKTIGEAMHMAKAEKGEQASVTVIPDGVSVIIK